MSTETKLKEPENYKFCSACHISALRMLEMHNVIVAQLAELSADNASMKKACDDFNIGKYKQLEAQLAESRAKEYDPMIHGSAAAKQGAESAIETYKAQLAESQKDAARYRDALVDKASECEKLSGKTGYCEQCEWSGRENKERQAFYVRKIKEYQAQIKELRDALELLHKNCCYQLSPDDDRPTHTPYYLFGVIEKALSGGG